MVKLKDQPIVEGTINGLKAHFLVDSGSDITILHTADAEKYNFGIRALDLKDHQISGLNSKEQRKAYQAYNVEFKLDTIKFKARYWVFDLDNIITSISVDAGIRINGIIGSDLMKKYGFIIDYNTRMVSFNAEPK